MSVPSPTYVIGLPSNYTAILTSCMVMKSRWHPIADGSVTARIAAKNRNVRESPRNRGTLFSSGAKKEFFCIIRRTLMAHCSTVQRGRKILPIFFSGKLNAKKLIATQARLRPIMKMSP